MLAAEAGTPRTRADRACRSSGIATRGHDSSPRIATVTARILALLSQSDAEALGGLAEGSIGRAIELADAGGLALYRSILGLLAQVPRVEVAELHAFADKLARPDAEEAYRASGELLSQFLGRMVVLAAGRPFGPEELIAGEGEAMARLAACADPARWADLRDRIGRDFANTDQLNLDRKQAILGAFFAMEEMAR